MGAKQTMHLTWPLRWLKCEGQALAVTIFGGGGRGWIGGFRVARVKGIGRLRLGWLEI